MKCDVCGTEVANSEEMKAHTEKEHSLDESDEELEEPAYLDGGPQQAPIVRGKSSS